MPRSSCENKLLPALRELARARSIVRRAELAEVVKTGRTHLMDAMPVTLGTGNRRLALADRQQHRASESGSGRACTALAQGGTAVGTGINAHPRFGECFASKLARSRPGLASTASQDYFEALELPGHGRRAVRPTASRLP